MKYLAYGSNMLSKRLRARVPSACALGVGQLRSWHLCFHKRSLDLSGKCSIVCSEKSGAIVHGVVFRIDPSEKRGLDKAERLGAGYRCEEVQVRMGEDELSAFTYVAQDSHLDESLLPYSWYKELVVAGALEHGLPSGHVEKLLAIQARSDPDLERDAMNRRLLR